MLDDAQSDLWDPIAVSICSENHQLRQIQKSNSDEKVVCAFDQYTDEILYMVPRYLVKHLQRMLAERILDATIEEAQTIADDRWLGTLHVGQVVRQDNFQRKVSA